MRDDLNSKLDKWAISPSVTREYYSSDRDHRPNDHCFWCMIELAWVETDSHLRDRIRNQGKRNG